MGNDSKSWVQWHIGPAIPVKSGDQVQVIVGLVLMGDQFVPSGWVDGIVTAIESHGCSGYLVIDNEAQPCLRFCAAWPQVRLPISEKGEID